MEKHEIVSQLKRLMLESRLLLDELEEGPTPPPPDNVVALPKPTDIEMEGFIGRPMLKEVKGKQLFTAGLGVQKGNVTQWFNLVMWGSIAQAASSLTKGQRARVVGKLSTNRYVDSDGVIQEKQVFTAHLISPVEHAFSEAM